MVFWAIFLFLVGSIIFIGGKGLVSRLDRLKKSQILDTTDLRTDIIRKEVDEIQGQADNIEEVNELFKQLEEEYGEEEE